MTVTTFGDLTSLLTKEGVPFRVDEAGQHLALPIRSGPLETEMVILWDAQTLLAQCVLPLPFDVPEDRIGAAESAIAWINHALKMPGFGLDHANRVLYYRLSVPRHADGSLTEDEVKRLIQTTVSTSEDFFASLRGVALDSLPPADVLADAARRRPTGSKPV